MKDLGSDFPEKFTDIYKTADGKQRAFVDLKSLKTLWFNTGTLCNIACSNCYIQSSPTNDSLVFLSKSEVNAFLDEVRYRNGTVNEIGFTGGEPFVNPDMIGIAECSLDKGYQVLILTNAMRPMMRTSMQTGLLHLNARFGSRLTLRISVDHYLASHHDSERGLGSFAKTLDGMKWLRDHRIRMTVAGRKRWTEDEQELRSGYADFFQRYKFQIDADDTEQLVLFPEMHPSSDCPEISTDCWKILNVSPESLMCASSRMVIKRKGSEKPSIVACTLLPYDQQFALGATLGDAERVVYLNHPHCAQCCVLGGASCSR